MITKKYKAGDITITAGKGGGIAVEFDNPPTATNGNITEEQLATLQESDANYILFNNEIYDLMDKTHSEDTLTYSHVGYENNVHLIKTISITISTLAWVLNKSEVGEGGGLTRVDVLPEPSEETYNENKIYENNNQLSYIGKEVNGSILNKDVRDISTGIGYDFNSGYAQGALIDHNYYAVIKAGILGRYDVLNNTLYEESSNDLITTGSSCAYDNKNNKLYINGGGAGHNEIICYDISTKSFQSVATISQEIKSTGATIINDYLYIVGGNSESNSIHKIFKVKIPEYTIEEISLPTLDISPCFASQYQGNIYFTANAGIIYKFNTTNNVLEKILNDSSATFSGVSSIQIKDNFGIIIGVNKIYSYDLSSNTLSLYASDTGGLNPQNGSFIYENNVYATFFNKFSMYSNMPKRVKVGFNINKTYKPISVGLGMTEVPGTKSGQNITFTIPSNTKMIIFKLYGEYWQNGKWSWCALSNPIPFTKEILLSISSSNSSDYPGLFVNVYSASVGASGADYEPKSILITEATGSNLKIFDKWDIVSGNNQMNVIAITF